MDEMATKREHDPNQASSPPVSAAGPVPPRAHPSNACFLTLETSRERSSVSSQLKSQRSSTKPTHGQPPPLEITPRSARRTGHSHNTHSGSSLSSSSLRGDDLHTVDTTEQVPGAGGGAKRCYPQTPLPALLAWLRRRHAAPSACTLRLPPPVSPPLCLSSPPLPAARASSPTPFTSRPPSPRACP